MHRRTQPMIGLAALLLGACDGQAPSDIGTVRQAGYQRQGYQRQGFDQKGYEFSANPLKGFSLRSLLPATPSLVDTARIVEGTLSVQTSPVDGTTASLFECSTPGYGLARSCGWREAGVGSCWPLSTVIISDSGGTDSMLRVCAGKKPCEAGWALTANDDTNGLQAQVSFVCPTSGYFNVLAASYASTVPLAVQLVPQSANFPIVEDRDLSGATLTAVDFANQTHQVRIRGVFPELSDARLLDAGVTLGNVKFPGTTLRYQVEVLDEKGDWTSLCANDFVDDTNNARPVALVTAGWWDATATRHDDPDLFTFSCRPGVITKCYRWGYRPWGSPGVPSQAFTDAMQTCTRMARADYCGNGQSWTQLDTEVNVYDDDGIQVRGSAAEVAEAALRQITFEAGWLPTGATCLSHVRWDNAPKSVMYENCPNLFDRDTSKPNAFLPRECNSPEEARGKNSATHLFNDSAPHSWDGG